jgi:hypothetical protein
MSFETLLAVTGVAVGIALGVVAGIPIGAQSAQEHACGPCDHVDECGAYECRPGVDGWKLKAGER